MHLDGHPVRPNQNLLLFIPMWTKSVIFIRYGAYGTNKAMLINMGALTTSGVGLYPCIHFFLEEKSTAQLKTPFN